MPVTISLFHNENIDAISPLADCALAEGYLFVERTLLEWRAGTQSFVDPYEGLWGIYHHGELFGLGGVSRDPYQDQVSVGRIRHVYIAPAYRGRGYGRQLIAFLLNKASLHFEQVRLFTENPAAACLYESLGFERKDGPKVTHYLTIACSKRTGQ